MRPVDMIHLSMAHDTLWGEVLTDIVCLTGRKDDR